MKTLIIGMLIIALLAACGCAVCNKARMTDEEFRNCKEEQSAAWSSFFLGLAQGMAGAQGVNNAPQYQPNPRQSINCYTNCYPNGYCSTTCY